jgi:hypothetical protein
VTAYLRISIRRYNKIQIRPQGIPIGSLGNPQFEAKPILSTVFFTQKYVSIRRSN